MPRPAKNVTKFPDILFPAEEEQDDRVASWAKEIIPMPPPAPSVSEYSERTRSRLIRETESSAEVSVKRVRFIPKVFELWKATPCLTWVQCDEAMKGTTLSNGRAVHITDKTHDVLLQTLDCLGHSQVADTLQRKTKLQIVQELVKLRNNVK